MEIIKKETQVREVEVIVLRYDVCDRCGEKIEQEDNYDIFKCQFVYETGARYPEGGDGELTKLDLCQACGKQAIEILKEHGYKPQESEWNDF